MHTVKFNANINLDHKTFEAGKEYELTDQEYNHLNELDIFGLPFDKNKETAKLIVDVD